MGDLMTKRNSPAVFTAGLKILFLAGTMLSAIPALAEAAGDAETEAKTASDIIVTGSRERRVVAGAVQEVLPQSRSTLTTTQLEKLVGLDSAVTGALKYVPGVHFGGGDASGISEGTFTIRGFSGDQIGFSRDGVPLNDPMFLTPHADFFGDPENYATVSVLYGSSSINSPSFTSSGGSVEITTLAPSDDAGATLKQGFGRDDLRRSFVRVNTGQHGPFKAWVSASFTNGDLWTQGGGQVKARRYEANVEADLGNDNTINFIASDFKMRSNSYLAPTLAQYRAGPWDAGLPDVAFPTQGGTNGVPDVLIAAGGSRALGRADFAIQTYGANGRFKLAENIRLLVDPYYVRVTHGAASVAATSLPEGLLGIDLSGDGDLLDVRPVGLAVYPTQHRLGGTARLDVDLGDTNILELGGWYDHVRGTFEMLLQPIKANGKPASIDGSIRLRDGEGNPYNFTDQNNVIETQKVWIQDNWNFAEGWDAILGLAYQDTQLKGENGAGLFTGTAYSRSESYHRLLPSFSLTYQPNGHHQFYYNTTSNMRVPAVASLYVRGATAKQKAETTWNQELGWRYNAGSLLINTAVFYDRFKNRQVSYAVTTGVTSYFNAGSVTTKGVEISATGQLPYHLNYSAAWSHVIAKQKDDYTAGGLVAQTSGQQLFNTPKNLASASLGYDDERFYFNALARYTGSFYGDLANTEKVKSYTVVDLAAGVRIANLFDQIDRALLSVNVTNLFDKHYLSGVYGGTVTATPGSFYGAPTYNRGAPRSVFVNLTLDI
jgi:iron complex outermembrane receptor protein